MENPFFKLLFYSNKETQVTAILNEIVKNDQEIEFYSTANLQKSIEYISKETPHLIVIEASGNFSKAIELSKKNLKGKKEAYVFFLDELSNKASFEEAYEEGVTELVLSDMDADVLKIRLQALIAQLKKIDSISGKRGLYIDKEKYLVYKDGEELSLPKKEFELLLLLTSKPRKVFTREEIYKIVWGSRIVVGDRTIDVHIRKIREKVGEEKIRTIKGVGYKYMG